MAKKYSLVKPVKVSSLPLPSGAATAANQVTANNYLASLASENVLTSKAPVIRDCSTVNITTVAWATLATAPSAIKEIQVVQNGGGYFYIKDEDSAAELAVVPAGFSGNIKIDIPSGKKLEAKAISANMTSGIITINLLG